MHESTTSSVFPDINVWVALTHGGHVHHHIAHDWFESLENGTTLSFCRFTQLGFLRLLTADVVMGDEVLTQAQAWAVYDRWLDDDRVQYAEEPPGVERGFRLLTRHKQASPKAWADAYLAAFAERAHMRLVTFDHAMKGRTPGLLLLESVD